MILCKWMPISTKQSHGTRSIFTNLKKCRQEGFTFRVTLTSYQQTMTESVLSTILQAVTNEAKEPARCSPNLMPALRPAARAIVIKMTAYWLCVDGVPTAGNTWLHLVDDLNPMKIRFKPYTESWPKRQ